MRCRSPTLPGCLEVVRLDPGEATRTARLAVEKGRIELFPGKKAIFAAASRRCIEDTRRVFEEAAEGLDGEEALHAMANAYTRLIAEHPEKLQIQMQTYITVAAVEAEGDHEFGEAVRAGWMKLWETAHLPLGADVNGTTTFMAYGMLVNTLAAMGFPPEHPVWQGMYPSARLEGRLEK